jgi:HlyD family secretion protein
MNKHMIAGPSDPFAVDERPKATFSVAMGLITLALFWGAFATWTVLAPLSSGAVAAGQVRVETHRKTVQHLEGGIIHEILVREGDMVQSGQVVMRLDDILPATAVDILQGQHDALAGLATRLIAERDGLSQIPFPTSLIARTDDPRVAVLLSGQAQIFRSRRSSLDTQLDILRQRIEQLRAEIGGYMAQAASLSSQVELISDETAVVDQLVAKGLERRPRLLALQREAASLQGNHGLQVGLIAKSEQAIGEARLQMENLQEERDEEVAGDLRDTEEKLAELGEKLRQAQENKRRTEIRAPQAGRVVNLRHFTLGGVVKPGEVLLDIVPQGEKMVIDAQIQPIDIDEVHAGLPAKIRLTAFKQRTTPTLPGVVLTVSADSFTDEKTGRTYYTASIEIAPEALSRLADVKLYPGMPAEAIIVTGSRTALEYFIDPIRQSFWRAFREA